MKHFNVTTTSFGEGTRSARRLAPLFLLLLLLTAALLLVSCGGGGEPGETSGAPGTTAPPATTAAPVYYTVRFLDAPEFAVNGEQTVIESQQIERNHAAHRPANSKMPVHEGYVFVGWDVKSYASITRHTDITAIYRPEDQYRITFCMPDGTPIGTPVLVKEGDPVTPPAETPIQRGYYFDSWQMTEDGVDGKKNFLEVNRRWPDFEKNGYETAEPGTVLDYRVTAVYEKAGEMIPYSQNLGGLFDRIYSAGTGILDPTAKSAAISAAFLSELTDGKLDAYFKLRPASFGSALLNTSFASGLSVIAEIGANPTTAAANATVYLAWDGTDVYAFAKVIDMTLLTRGPEYCTTTLGADGNPDPWKNDGIEIYYAFGRKAGLDYRFSIKTDAFGYNVFTNYGVRAPEGAVPSSVVGTQYVKGSTTYYKVDGVWYQSTPMESKYFNEVKESGFVMAQDVAQNCYYILYRLPAKTESGRPLVAGDICSFAVQLDDLRSLDFDPVTEEGINMMASGDIKIENYKNFWLGDLPETE